VQREGNLSSPVAKSRFYHRCLERPCGKRLPATHKYPFSLEERIGVEFARLPEKLCQSVLCFELQPDPVVFEAELMSGACELVLNRLIALRASSWASGSGP